MRHGLLLFLHDLQGFLYDAPELCFVSSPLRHWWVQLRKCRGFVAQHVLSHVHGN